MFIVHTNPVEILILIALLLWLLHWFAVKTYQGIQRRVRGWRGDESN